MFLTEMSSANKALNLLGKSHAAHEEGENEITAGITSRLSFTHTPVRVVTILECILEQVVAFFKVLLFQCAIRTS